MASPISKNQRAAGPKQEQKKMLCKKGHEQVYVLFVGTGFDWVCECDGYAPINNQAPYAQIKPSGLAGKKRDGEKSRGSYPAGR